MKLYSPSAPGKPWRVTWTPPGMTRQVKDRKTKAGAEKLAKEILFERARVWGFVPKGHNPAREVSSLKIPPCRAGRLGSEVPKSLP